MINIIKLINQYSKSSDNWNEYYLQNIWNKMNQHLFPYEFGILQVCYQREISPNLWYFPYRAVSILGYCCVIGKLRLPKIVPTTINSFFHFFLNLNLNAIKNLMQNSATFTNYASTIWTFVNTDFVIGAENTFVIDVIWMICFVIGVWFFV